MKTLTISLCAITVVATANIASPPNPFEVRHVEVVKTFKSVTGNGFDRIPRITPESMLAANGKKKLGFQNDPAHLDHHRYNPMTEVKTTTDLFKMQLLQLVGILKEANPVAYEAKSPEEIKKDRATLPPTALYKDLKSDARAARFKLRALTEAETKGLKSLQDGAEFVPLDETGKHAYIGAIRADKTCLECHEEHREGSLLGAFIYQYDNGKMPPAKPLTSNP